MKTNIAGIEFSSCIINASGPSDATLDELEIIANSDSAAIMLSLGVVMKNLDIIIFLLVRFSVWGFLI